MKATRGNATASGLPATMSSEWNEEEGGIRPRKLLKLDWSQCLCHCTDSSGALTAFTEVSWRRLEESSRVRNDATWRFVGKHWSDGPRLQEVYNAQQLEESGTRSS